MKRTIALFLILIMALTVPACAAEQTGPVPGENSESARTSYTDVAPDDWYAEAAEYVLEEGIMNGTGNGRFSPKDTFTRAQLATVLYRIAGEPKVIGEDGFSDTDQSAWYTPAVLWAEQTKVVNGVGNGRFAPDDPVTQEQLVTMLWRMEDQPEGAVAEDATPYAAQAVGWARENGIAPATADYTFTPKENAVRGQIAILLHGYLLGKEEQNMEQISLTLAGQPVTVEWENNPSVGALRDLLRSGPLPVELSRYGGFEQVGSLGTGLPRNDVQTTTAPGDIVLYSGSNMVIFYGSNSWAYTRLGHITDKSKSELEALLGGGDVTAVLSLSRRDESGISGADSEAIHE